MLFVAPDTNFILHFKPLCEIGPVDLKLSRTYAWLVTGQVLRELDIRKGTGDKTLRKRARKAAKELEQAEAQHATFPTGCSVQAHFRTGSFDFEAKGLLPNEGDDKIIADILDFKEQHATDEVLLLTDDVSMRMRAKGYGISVLNPDEIDPEGDLKRPDLEDDRDERLRLSEERNRILAMTQPDIDCAFEDGSREVSYEVYSFSQAELEEAISKAAEPANLEEALNNTIFTGFLKQNLEYENDLTRFAVQLRSYFLETWVLDYRTIEIATVLFSRNGVQPLVVNVSLTFDTTGTVLEKRSDQPKAPKRPARAISIFGGSSSFGPSIDYSALMKLERVNMRAPSVTQTDRSVSVTYSLLRIPQEAETLLDPFFIEFANDVDPPACIKMQCEVRAQNMNAVLRHNLLVKLQKAERPLPGTFYLF